ncbi:MAG: hypothetical protein B7X04_03940 [Parcubacteria group bacterium 21-54-25]|nr:MAG: hypothetical protein B7X04_03940 [Parcubacteria group bacterium 21-54-25]HQU08146.1 hypothetical protein [Candidatus Paceibacterota bacterium]
MSTPRVVLYHAHCPDGFGGAYAAWKKFGNEATYLPIAYDEPPPENLSGAHLYFIDFCYSKETMDQFVAQAEGVTVLDHHRSMRETVESMPEHVFNENCSGATIAWEYFHPDEPLPLALCYIADGDLHRKELPHSMAVLLYLYTLPYQFELWDEFVRTLENEQGYADICARGTIYEVYHNRIVKQLADAARPVSFEGQTCYLIDAPRMFATDVGEKLLARQPTLALLVHAQATGIAVSVRSTGAIDAGAVARKYGRNGHSHSAAFFVPYEGPLPWTLLDAQNQLER